MRRVRGRVLRPPTGRERVHPCMRPASRAREAPRTTRATSGPPTREAGSVTGLGLSIIAPDIPSMPATPAPDPRPELRPWQLAVAGAALYLAWLNWGTRENPPIPYQKYRSGQTFESVRETLKREQDAVLRDVIDVA